MAEGTLRIGVLCDSLQMQRWQVECIRQVLAVKGVEPVVVVLNDTAQSSSHNVMQRILHYPFRTALYRFYRKHYFRPGAMRMEDASGLLTKVPVLRCRTDKRAGSEFFLAKDLASIAERKPDVLLRFGFNIIRGELLDLPRHGVWSYHHADEEYYRGGPPGFWEIMEDDPITGAILQRLTDRLDAGHVLRKGWFRTIDHSLQETVDTVLMHSAPWAAQVCRELLAGHAEVAIGVQSATSARVHRYPRNGTFLAFLQKQAQNKIKFHRAELNEHEEWNVGLLYAPIQSLLEDKPSLNVRWLPPPGAGQFRADPFGYMVDGHLNMVYEKYDSELHRGEISRLRPKRDNNLKRSRTMLELDTHLSYPFVVERAGEVYVIPESAATGRVELYRMDGGNDALQHVSTLLEEPLFDPTVFEHEGRWWIFGTRSPLTNVELFAYHSERFEGPYEPHLLNPIKSDIRSSRPGGTPFHHEGNLWRPAQDSSTTYGGRIALNRIVELAPTRFVEETVKYIGPLKGSAWSKGTHTISAVGNITLVDGKRYVTDKAKRDRARKHKVARLVGAKRKVDPDDDVDEDDEDQ